MFKLFKGYLEQSLLSDKINIHDSDYKNTENYKKIKDQKILNSDGISISLESFIERYLLEKSEVLDNYESKYDMGNVYEFDKKAVFSDGYYRCLSFDAYDRSWLDFIVASRKGKEPWKGYDVIEGGVANDKVIDTVEDYLNGTITVEQALGQLVYAKPNHQICLLNQELIDHHLYYMDSLPLMTE